MKNNKVGLFVENVIKKYLNEKLTNIEIPKHSDKYLYHGTKIKNLESIKSYGLIPDFGDVVTGTEAYQNYMDDAYFNPDDRVEGILFFSDNPETWTYSNFGGKPNINDALLVVVEKNDTIYQKRGYDIFDSNNRKVDTVKFNRYNYLDYDKLPPFIENGDYFSFNEQEPIDLLYGERLIKFINEIKK